MQLRPYQLETKQAVTAALATHNSVLVVWPTGTGKTVLFTEIAHEWECGRVLVICPQIELIDQAARKILNRTGLEPGIEQGPRRSNESWWAQSPFVVSSKQTLTSRERWTDKHGLRHQRKRYERFAGVGLVIVDEAHYAITELYREVIDYFRGQGAKVLGVTATPNRGDGKAMGQVFEHCAFNYGIDRAVGEGWLVGPRAHCAQLESLDLSQVATNSKTGDFVGKQLAEAMETEKVVYEIAEITASESRGLKTVVYCESVAQARQVANLLSDQHGYRADWISGACPPDRRSRVLRSFTEPAGDLEILTNVGVLTTGWDYPQLAHLVMARPTKSLSLYTQIMGRGMRPLPGVVDFAGSTAETRRAAIAASDKPHFKVTDLRDNSLEHKLVTVVDVLGGDMTLAARNRAKEMLEREGEARPLAEVLAEATAKQQEAEEAERRRLAARAASAKYRQQQVDPFDTTQRGRVHTASSDAKAIKFGKYKGEPIDQVPIDYLRFIASSPKYPAWMKGPCWAELKRRKGSPAAGPANTEAAAVAARLQRLLLEV